VYNTCCLLQLKLTLMIKSLICVFIVQKKKVSTIMPTDIIIQLKMMAERSLPPPGTGEGDGAALSSIFESRPSSVSSSSAHEMPR